MRFLVTGGCGFVGSAVVRILVDRGHRVLNIDRRPRSRPVPALASVSGRPGYARLEANICDRDMMRAVFREFLPEKVIHLAAAAPDQPDTHFDVEVAGSWSVLQAAQAARDLLPPAERDAFRLVCAAPAPLQPEDPGATALPPSPHDALQAAAAALTWEWSHANGLPLAVCAAGEVFGPWQADTSFAARLVNALLVGRRIELEAGGMHQRDWMPVRDLANGLVCAALNAPPMTRHDISHGAERRDVDMAESICALLDERLGRPGGQTRSRLISLAEGGVPLTHPMLDGFTAERELGWKPAGFHAGLEAMISWAVGRAAAGAGAAA